MGALVGASVGAGVSAHEPEKVFFGTNELGVHSFEVNSLWSRNSIAPH